MLDFEGCANDVRGIGIHAEDEGGTVPFGSVVIVCSQHLYHLQASHFKGEIRKILINQILFLGYLCKKMLSAYQENTLKGEKTMKYCQNLVNFGQKAYNFK
jgi:hypothetical protein